MAFRKRVFARAFNNSRFGRPMKRRRFTNTRRRRFGAKNRSITNRTETAYSVGNFRTKRLSKRTFRTRLWRDTWSDQHWRSVQSAAGTAVPSFQLNEASVTVVRPADEFWTVGGGAIPAAQTGVVPAFRNSVTLRGGIASLAVSNAAENDTLGESVRVTIFYIWTRKNPASATEFFVPVTVPIRWDPSVEPDFTKYGSVFGRKETLLKPGDTVEVFHRQRIQKIDLDVYNPLEGTGGSRLEYWILASRVEGPVAADPPTLQTVTSHNYSFVGDAQEQGPI